MRKRTADFLQGELAGSVCPCPLSLRPLPPQSTYFVLQMLSRVVSAHPIHFLCIVKLVPVDLHNPHFNPLRSPLPQAPTIYIYTYYRHQLTPTIVLNRARPENEERERKTASGRTFRVQG